MAAVPSCRRLDTFQAGQTATTCLPNGFCGRTFTIIRQRHDGMHVVQFHNGVVGILSKSVTAVAGSSASPFVACNKANNSMRAAFTGGMGTPSER